MTEWDPEAVIAAANEWAWIPEGAPHVRTDDYLVVQYPEWFATPTAARVMRAPEDAVALLDEVHEIVTGWGRDRIWWVVSDIGPSAAIERELLRLGAQVTERSDILAIPLRDGVPDLAVPADLLVRPVLDEETVRAALTVEADAFDWAAPTEEQLRAALAEVRAGADAGLSGRFVAYVDGLPAATGGWGRAGAVLRLWGAGTARVARGRGAYRAVLEARLRRALELQCTLALAHGRVHTSSPILQRVGFTRYGEQRMLRLDL